MWLRQLLLLFSLPVTSDSLRPQGLEHASPPCPSSSPRVCPSSCSLHLWCCPAISSSDTLFSFFSNEFCLCIRWPKFWSFSFSIYPSSEYSWLISCKIDWFHLLAVQGYFWSLLQHHPLMALILWCSDVFMVQLSQPFVITGKTMSSVQSLSRVWHFATPWTAACQASLSITNSWSLLEHVYWVSDAIQPSHPLSYTFPPAFNLSQHKGLFKWVSSSYQVAKVLEFQVQHQSFQWIFRTDFL